MKDYIGQYKSTQFLKKGGKTKIHIKPENRGKFTEYCGGKVTAACIQRGLNSPDPAVRKMANFARNARKWKHQTGGKLFNAPPLDLVQKSATIPNDPNYSSVQTTKINFPEIPAKMGLYKGAIQPYFKQAIQYGKGNTPNDTVYSMNLPNNQWVQINKDNPSFPDVSARFETLKTQYTTPEYMTQAKNDGSGIVYTKEMGGKIEQILKTYEETKSIGRR